MPDLGPHAAFILAAYAVAFVGLGTLTLFTVEDDRKQRRLLIDMERRGIRRRSAAKPAAPSVTTRTTKLTKAPSQRKRGTARPRKTRS